MSVSGFTFRGFDIAGKGEDNIAFVIDFYAARDASIVGNRLIGNVAGGINVGQSIDTREGPARERGLLARAALSGGLYSAEFVEGIFPEIQLVGRYFRLGGEQADLLRRPQVLPHPHRSTLDEDRHRVYCE